MRDGSLPGGNNSVWTRIMVGCLVSTKDLGECLGLKKSAVPSDAGIWSCDILGRGNVPVSFYLYGFSNDRWSIEITDINNYSLPYLTLGTATADIVDIGPGPSDDRIGDFSLHNSVSIWNLSALGSPVDGLISDISVLKVNPFTIQVPNGSKKYICKSVKTTIR